MPSAEMATDDASSTSAPRKSVTSTVKTPERKYQCQFCNRAFSRSEHRSRHERSHTKERPFKCQKCKSTFVRRDLLLRHDRTVHAKDGGVPLVSEGRRRGGQKSSPKEGTSKQPSINIDPATLEQIEASSDGMVDLETAAMLMTDFQHKAAAAANGQLHHGEGPDPAFSPDRASLLETPIEYMPGAATLPQMPWDAFMSQPPPEPKAPSMSSSVSSQDHLNQPPFTNLNTIQPLQTQLPPIMERQSSLTSGLVPAFPSLTDSLPVSGSPTPNALSPWPSTTGPISPVNYRRSPGPTQALTLVRPTQVLSEEQQIDLANLLRSDEITLPATDLCNKHLSTYFNLFHHHMPFLHPESFTPAAVQPALLLAVLSIGALYNFDREQAYAFHHGSRNLVTRFLQKDNFDSRRCPLWTMQSTLLNMIFESWSGGPQGLEWACSIKSLLTNMVAGNKYKLAQRTKARGNAPISRDDWIEDEGCRRTYYAVYIFFGMLTMTFNHTPAMSFNELECLQMPSSESLWNLPGKSEEAWRESLAATNTITLKEAHDELFQGRNAKYSAFATRVMINALFLEVWNLRRSSESLQDVVLEWKIRIALETWERSLSICEPEIIVVPLSTPHRSHPLIFNAMAVYRNCRARLEVDLKGIQEALRYHNSYEVAGQMSTARDAVKRSHEMIRIIEQCFECIEIAALQGINWVAKTSATNWSIEHPLCGFDLMVILSLWLYRLEVDDERATDEEISMYSKVRNLFDDDAYGSTGKLSSTVARVWGSMFDGVVVWGISKLMGESFKLHSEALVGYEGEMEPETDAALPSLPDQGFLTTMETAY